MAFRLRRQKSVQASLRKIALEQIDKAVAEIRDERLDKHESVHQVRKRCKKLRGLIRLVRPRFADYADENAMFRDAARELSFVRDAQSTLECFDKLTDRFREQLDLTAFAAVREQLVERRGIVAGDEAGATEKLDEFLEKMLAARGRAARWKIHGDGFPAIRGGLKRTYGRGRDALDAACREMTAESFHEWRKRVKYHWHHLRLLRRVWPEMLKAQRNAASRLSDLLGDDHDLAVLRRTLLDDPRRFGRGEDLQALIGLIDRRQADLRAAAQPLGRRLFAESPKRLAARLGAYWDCWKDE